MDGVEEYGIISGVRRKADTSGGAWWGVEGAADAMPGLADAGVSSMAGGLSFIVAGLKSSVGCFGGK